MGTATACVTVRAAMASVVPMSRWREGRGKFMRGHVLVVRVLQKVPVNR